jgi:hypothetical protein
MDRIVVPPPGVAVLSAAVVTGATLLVLLVRAAIEGRPATGADLVTALAVGVLVGLVEWIVSALVARRAMRGVASAEFDRDRRTPGADVRDAYFELWDESAQRVLTLGQDEAARLEHHWFGTEHLLLGILREPGTLAARVLVDLGAEPENVRAAIASLIGGGRRGSDADVGLTPRAKRVIELAIREARGLGDRSIRAEHLLLGLLREGEGIAAGVLESMGVDPDRVREEILRGRREE